MEQLEVHAPQVLDKLQQLNNTGCVEFLAEPYSHGLSSLANAESFAADVKKQSDKMTEYFGRSAYGTPQLIAHLQRRHRTAGCSNGIPGNAHRGSQARPRMEESPLRLQLL